MATELTTELTNEYPLPKNAYAAFDAVSLRNLIIQRLNDQGIFTDQNYIGSNLASIIDIVSYAYNTLIFYLNRTSSESTFTEAQLYENVNKIVKLLDYKPIGFQTSTLTFQCSAQNLSPATYTIPRYSSLNVGGILFSFNEDISFTVSSISPIELTELANRKLLYQGVYKENPIYIAAGDVSEVVTINATNTLIDHFNVDVYVFENDQQRWFQYKNVPNFYSERSSSRSFEKRLNSSLQYEITFGDGINGRKLNSGDRVALYYLQSSGDTGIIGPNNLQRATKSIYSTPNYNIILADVNTNEQFNYLTNAQFSTNLVFNNFVGSTIAKNIETADEIRKNAPANFKSQYRLVTKEDYKTYIETNFGYLISDVRVFSNWDYTSKYLKYFNDIQVSPANFRQILLNQVLYSDACNFNNIYLCVVPKVSQGSSLKYLLPAQKELIVSNIEDLKTLTTQITFLDPIFKAVSFGVPTENTTIVTDSEFCELEIVKSASTKIASQSIQNQVTAIFNNTFNPANFKLGGIFQYTSLVQEILAVEGVSSIRTRRLDTSEVYNGLSLFLWNPAFSDLDKKTVTNDVELLDFELVYFNNLNTISTKITVVDS